MSNAEATATNWDRPIGAQRRSGGVMRPAIVSGPPTVEDAINAWIAARPFAHSTIRRIHENLESRRARGWRAERGIVTIEQFTAAEAADYVLYLRDRGAAPGTLRKFKNYFTSLAQFCAETSRYKGLEGDELLKLKLPPLVERIPEALTEDECLRLLAAAEESPRDRLIVETLLLTGVRLSELCRLTLDELELDSRPAYLVVRGSVYNPSRPKAPRQRRIVIDYDAYGFGRGYVGRLRRYIEQQRPQSHCRELFLSERCDKQTGSHPPLTTVGVQRLMSRLEATTGIHCNPHKQRHTFATRCVDNDVPLFQLQEALGHKSLDMVRRYYSTSQRALARGFYQAFGGGAV